MWKWMWKSLAFAVYIWACKQPMKLKKQINIKSVSNSRRRRCARWSFVALLQWARKIFFFKIPLIHLFLEFFTIIRSLIAVRFTLTSIFTRNSLRCCKSSADTNLKYQKISLCRCFFPRFFITLRGKVQIESDIVAGRNRRENVWKNLWVVKQQKTILSTNLISSNSPPRWS